jgi:hypothetical protein
MDTIHNQLTLSYAYAPYIPTTTPRRASIKTSTLPNTTTTTTIAAMPTHTEVGHASTPNNSHKPALHPVRTRSVGGPLSAGVVFERDPASPPTDEDIIIVTVRVSRKERRNSFDEPLPDR